MEAVKPYLDDNKKTDPYKNCRTKFVILVTDGQDTLYCGGTGSGNQADQYKRRRASVAKVKALRDAGYKVFVIGLGDKMPDFLKYTLNWMAYYGGTENPLATKKGSPSALNIGAITSDPCTGSATTAPRGATAAAAPTSASPRPTTPGRSNSPAMPSSPPIRRNWRPPCVWP